MTTKARVVLAYSGASRMTAAIPSLRDQQGADVVALTLDLGEGRDLDEVRERALAAGAVRAHVLDVRDEFVREYILPALQAGVLDADGRPVASALARPLIAKKLVEVARIEQAEVVAHGCLPDGRDQRRIENALHALDASMRILRVSGPRTSSATMSGARVAAASDAPACVELAFERGVPVAINGVEMTLTELLESIATIAAGHGVGGAVVHAAHGALEALVTPAEIHGAKRANAARYAVLVREGAWFSPVRQALDAFSATLQEQVTGTVRVELFQGAFTISGRHSPFALEPART